jgi:hypothetical protein
VLSSSSSTGWGLSTDRFGRLRAALYVGLLVCMNLSQRVAEYAVARWPLWPSLQLVNLQAQRTV